MENKTTMSLTPVRMAIIKNKFWRKCEERKPSYSVGDKEQYGSPSTEAWAKNWRRKWQPTPVFLFGKFHGLRSLAGYSPWSRKESDTIEQLTALIYIYIYMLLYIYNGILLNHKQNEIILFVPTWMDL